MSLVRQDEYESLWYWRLYSHAQFVLIRHDGCESLGYWRLYSQAHIVLIRHDGYESLWYCTQAQMGLIRPDWFELLGYWRLYSQAQLGLIKQDGFESRRYWRLHWQALSWQAQMGLMRHKLLPTILYYLLMCLKRLDECQTMCTVNIRFAASDLGLHYLPRHVCILDMENFYQP